MIIAYIMTRHTQPKARIDGRTVSAIDHRTTPDGRLGGLGGV
jgi:hypothetical protein